MPYAPIDVTFRDVRYEVPGLKRRSDPVEILHGISGHVAAGESMAILGPSGSGKTSLLNVLAGRGMYGPSGGEVLFGGQKRGSRTKRAVGYVMQDDVFFSKLTVLETLQFTAGIRLGGVSSEEKAKRIDDVIAKLRLGACQHVRIGDQQFDKGISGGERKRVNIANELLCGPSVLLADECTSGLDSASAYTVINLIKDLCNEGRTVIATIHQPSSKMYGLFDKILLLAAGRVAYCGPPARAAAYFASVDLPFPSSGYNPADYMLELIIDTSDSEESTQARVLAAWERKGSKLFLLPSPGVRDEPRARRVAEGIEIDVEGGSGTGAGEETSSDEPSDGTDFVAKSGAAAAGSASPSSLLGGFVRAIRKRWMDVKGTRGKDGIPDKYPTSWWTQVYILGQRSVRQKRGVLLEPIHILEVALTTLICAAFWFRIEPIESKILDRLGALSFFSVFWSFVSTFSALFSFPSEKAVLNKDRASGAYRLSAYYVAKTMVEVPADMLYPTAFTFLVYFTVSLNLSARAFFVFLGILILTVLTAQSIGLLISAAVMNVKKAQVLASYWILSSMLASGYYIRPESIPKFLRPFRALSFIKYTFDALVKNEFQGREFECVPKGEASTVFSSNGFNCPITGQDVVVGAELDNSFSILGNAGILMVWIVVLRLLGYYALKWIQNSHKPRQRRRKVG